MWNKTEYRIKETCWWTKRNRETEQNEGHARRSESVCRYGRTGVDTRSIGWKQDSIQYAEKSSPLAEGWWSYRTSGRWKSRRTAKVVRGTAIDGGALMASNKPEGRRFRVEYYSDYRTNGYAPTTRDHYRLCKYVNNETSQTGGGGTPVKRIIGLHIKCVPRRMVRNLLRRRNNNRPVKRNHQSQTVFPSRQIAFTAQLIILRHAATVRHYTHMHLLCTCLYYTRGQQNSEKRYSVRTTF